MSNSTSSPLLILDPWQHAEGVSRFFHYFHLRQRRPDMPFLREILAAFSHFPYENLSKIIKLDAGYGSTYRIRLPEEVMADYMAFRLGGTCFSLTFFLQTILTHCGFFSYPVMADMQAGENIHCALVVLLEGGKYLVDPGYLLHQPMELHPAGRKLFRTPFAGVEITHNPSTGRYALYTFDRVERKWRYTFTDRPTPPAEFLQHWYASFHKTMMHALCLTRATPHGLLYVRKYFLRETTFEGKRNRNIRRNYHAVLRDLFGIREEIVEQAELALQRNLARERARREHHETTTPGTGQTLYRRPLQ
ncbi:MAG: hypothetical protein D6736_00455 [Nitrospinota bacterium]|nr:MAG: hypothetical protein D6736_00455 [Nitrospinota bacterium]